ncbi:pectinesterase family protein [Hymenobacter sp. 5516J-16]|uniref:pectinesterase family protein n=1 Tax=Hymenobacter sp. 5516J-16 TaxID=2932253 RepID=UPI00293E86D1|nr:pectinesterase family protein [Hymenobacter sp. 5516J-16]
MFNQCRITGDAPAGSFYLGRPWRPYAKTVYLRCELGKQIKSEGWDHWDKETNKQTARYAEYQSRGPGAAPGSAWGGPASFPMPKPNTTPCKPYCAAGTQLRTKAAAG